MVFYEIGKSADILFMGISEKIWFWWNGVCSNQYVPILFHSNIHAHGHFNNIS